MPQCGYGHSLGTTCCKRTQRNKGAEVDNLAEVLEPALLHTGAATRRDCQAWQQQLAVCPRGARVSFTVSV